MVDQLPVDIVPVGRGHRPGSRGPAGSRQVTAAFTVGVATVLAIASWPARAQEPPEQAPRDALAAPALIHAIDKVRGADERSVATLTRLASIVSPSGQEFDRATAVSDCMTRAGLADVRVDGTPNVVGRIPGTSGRALVFVAILDDLPIIERFQREGAQPRREGDRVVGPATAGEIELR